MNNTCLTCGQILPKTVLVCPNCGGRQFSNPNSPDNSVEKNPQTTQYHVPFESQLANNQPLEEHWEQSFSHSHSAPQPQAPFAVPVQNPYPQYEQSYTQNYHPIPSQTYAPPAVTPTYLPPVTTAPLRQANTMQYAGFIRRGFAFVFDVALFSLLTGLAWQHITNNKYKIMYVSNSELPLALAIAGGILYLLVTAFLTSRARQGSIGKRILGLWVFNMQGQRIGFFHAFFREVVKLALLPFAFVMWFTARKQTLHDLLGRTVVLLDR